MRLSYSKSLFLNILEIDLVLSGLIYDYSKDKIILQIYVKLKAIHMICIDLSNINNREDKFIYMMIREH